MSNSDKARAEECIVYKHDFQDDKAVISLEETREKIAEALTQARKEGSLWADGTPIVDLLHVQLKKVKTLEKKIKGLESLAFTAGNFGEGITYKEDNDYLRKRIKTFDKQIITLEDELKLGLNVNGIYFPKKKIGNCIEKMNEQIKTLEKKIADLEQKARNCKCH